MLRFGLVLVVGLVLGSSRPADADISVVGRYTFVNGDTATRTAYYSSKRARVTTPDGREFIYDTQAKRVTIVDHAEKRYYTGTLKEADSLASKLLLERRQELKPLIEANQERWAQMMKGFNDSIVVHKDPELTRTIAGYPCTRWTMTAASYMTHERWVARGLSVANYAPELEKVIMATVLDPLGRQLMRMLVQMHGSETSEPEGGSPGTVLGSTTRFQTLSQSGSFSWEAFHVDSKPIPKNVWNVPEGYSKVQP